MQSDNDELGRTRSPVTRESVSLTPQTPSAAPLPGDVRLPWLDDTPRRAGGRAVIELTSWIGAGALLVAATSYWAGLHSLDPADREVAGAEVSVRLPEARAPQPEPAREPQQIAAPAPEPQVSGPQRPQPVPDMPAAARNKMAPSARARRPQSEQKLGSTVDPYPLWPSNKIEGANGRLVRLGSFGSEQDARKAWQRILADYPGMARLNPAVVSGTSLRDGRPFYRLQVGTNSQAHSAVLCDRSRALHVSCSVVGLVVGEGP